MRKMQCEIQTRIGEVLSVGLSKPVEDRYGWVELSNRNGDTIRIDEQTVPNLIKVLEIYRAEIERDRTERTVY